MRNNNPLIIPRNLKVEEALNAAEKNNFDSVNKLINILCNPYIVQENIADYQTPQRADEKYKTFCGT